MALSRFMKVYANLPLAERDMTCCVIEGEPISWKLAYQEISKRTNLGEKIQLELEKLGLI